MLYQGTEFEYYFEKYGQFRKYLTVMVSKTENNEHPKRQ